MRLCPVRYPVKSRCSARLGNGGGKFQRERANRKASSALVGRILVLVTGWIIKLFASGVNKDGILGFLAKIDFRPGQLKPGRLDFRRRVLDEQDGQAISSDFVDLGHDRAKPAYK